MGRSLVYVGGGRMCNLLVLELMLEAIKYRMHGYFHLNKILFLF